MLILSRRSGEEIYILTSEGPIEIQIVGVKSGVARVGIKAPTNVKIYRKEVYERKFGTTLPRSDNSAGNA
jgi:carbon storage regulator